MRPENKSFQNFSTPTFYETIWKTRLRLTTWKVSTPFGVPELFDLLKVLEYENDSKLFNWSNSTLFYCLKR